MLHRCRLAGPRSAHECHTSPAAALAETQASILAELVPERPGRVCVRAVTQPSSPYPSKRNRKGPIAQHAECTLTIRHPYQAPRATPDQQKHPGTPENQPP
jgi:hypothetical protein